MSADNGIYILETPSCYGTYEYRVAHLQAVENLDYNPDTKQFEPDNDYLRIRNAREMWGRNCKFTRSREVALSIADSMLRNCMICEYGIQFIRINGEF